MYITLDIGGSKARIGVFTGTEKKSLLNIVYVSIQDDFENEINKIYSSIDSLASGKQINAIAIGIAGSINEERTGIGNSGNLKSWENINIKSVFEKKYSCKVVLANDTFMAGFSEAVYGEIKKDFLYINWGTGIGGCLVNFFGNNDLEIRPTELGHQIIINDGISCRCGQKGCLDAYVGGKGIEKIYHKKAFELTNEEWTAVLERMAIGIINAIVVYPVKYIIFGGGVAINQAEKLKTLEKIITNNIKIVPAPIIRLASMRDNAAIYGGLLFIKDFSNNKN